MIVNMILNMNYEVTLCSVLVWIKICTSIWKVFLDMSARNKFDYMHIPNTSWLLGYL